MELKTSDGKLALDGVYKLVAWVWALGAGALFVPMFALLTVVGVVTGQMSVNGEMVYGRGPVLMAMLPGLIGLPLIITLQGFLLGGVITFGLWLYQRRRPLTLVAK